MKGVVFTEFLELVEEKFGYEVVDKIITANDAPSGGAYTAVGTYPFSELAGMLGHLSKITGLQPEALLQVFGKHLFNTFHKSYNHFFQGTSDAFEFLMHIEDYIHVEVKKLYPDAELPRFESFKSDPNTLHLIYSSERKLYPLAQGLIESSLEHFNTKADLVYKLLKEDGSHVEFIITRKD